METMTLDRALDAAMGLSFDQREMLLEIIRSRQIEARRDEIARDAELLLRSSKLANSSRNQRKRSFVSYVASLRALKNDKARSDAQVSTGISQVRSPQSAVASKYRGNLAAHARGCVRARLGYAQADGKLLGLWACSCGYDCRIVFVVERDPETNLEMNWLLDIGTHDEVIDASWQCRTPN